MEETKTTECWHPAKYIRPNGDVLDFTGLYEVSDLGRVRSLNYHKTKKTKIMRQGTIREHNGCISYRVPMRKDNKRYYLSVHRLVLSSFREQDYFEGAIVDHIDARTNSDCNDSLNNLHWVTCSQNRTTDHCQELQSKTKTNHPARSNRVRVTDLTTRKVTEFPSAKEAGRSLGISPYIPSSCINQHDGYYKKRNLHFEYID